MPDHDPLEPGRRALDGLAPSPDLWAEAERRAAAGGVVPLVPDGDGVRRPWRWLAAAAAVALVAGTVAVVIGDDDGDGQVDTTPDVTDPAGPTVIEGDGCTYGVTGDPIVMQPGPPDPPIFAGAPADEGTVSHAELGGQRVEVRVPGLTVIDLVGERVEPVELERGTADVWFGPDFVQVRWFTGGQERCESFSVTVTGSTEDGNRHAAVAFAERILLPSDLGPAEVAEPPISEALPGTTWRIVELHQADGSVPLDGVASPDRLFLSFSDGEISGGDGCNFFRGAAAFDDDGYLEAGARLTTYRLCDGPEDRLVQETMGAVLGADRITVRRLGGGRLELSGGVKDRIVLEPESTVEVGEAYAIWPITYPGQPTGDLVHPMETTAETAVAFAKDMLGWNDAKVGDGDSEPSEDGRSGAVHEVRSDAVGGAVTVWVTRGTGSDGLIVYRVDVPGRTLAEPQEASVSISGLNARVEVSPVPGATFIDPVKLFYGDELLGEGEMGEEIRLTAVPTMPGRVLIFFHDAAGLPISAWGMALPAGDFAAG